MVPESILVLISIPLYAIVIGLEILMSSYQNWRGYSLKDTLTNLYLMTVNSLLDVLTRAFTYSVLAWLYTHHRLFTLAPNWLYFVSLILAVDLLYYWLHRVDHSSRLFWAVHVTHHSSEYFNLTTGFRSSVFQPLYRFIFYMPLPLMGFTMPDIVFIHSALQIFGILVHTEYFNRIPVLEYFLVMPSHHRVHHAYNVKYLDRNLAQVFIIWDRLFGTFQPEDPRDPPVYGLTKPPLKRDGWNIIMHEWKNIWQDLQRPLPLSVKFKYLFYPPGWSHDGSSKTASELRRLRMRGCEDARMRGSACHATGVEDAKMRG